MDLDEHKEPESVSLADTVADPRAVVVMGGHAMVALFAVLAPQGLFDVADCAVLVLDKKDNVLLIRRLGLHCLRGFIVKVNFYLGPYV